MVKGDTGEKGDKGPVGQGIDGPDGDQGLQGKCGEIIQCSLTEVKAEEGQLCVLVATTPLIYYQH